MMFWSTTAVNESTARASDKSVVFSFGRKIADVYVAFLSKSAGTVIGTESSVPSTLETFVTGSPIATPSLNH
uniref:hypothetical protein n=1 Tax=Streptococcus pluranimalium TaxID=82348 RepID=UPI003F68FFC7